MTVAHTQHKVLRSNVNSNSNNIDNWWRWTHTSTQTAEDDDTSCVSFSSYSSRYSCGTRCYSHNNAVHTGDTGQLRTALELEVEHKGMDGVDV